MRKETVVRFLGVSAAILLLGVSVVRARAEGEIQINLDGESQSVVGEVMGESDSGSVAKVEQEVESSYYLPYPGVLPDQSLYLVKMIRDRIVEWLTIDLRSKADLWVFYADKRFGAGIALTDGNKTELGVATYEKAIKYQERAINALAKLKDEGKDAGELANKIEQATTKYRQVIEHQEGKNEQFRGSSAKLKEMVQSNREKVLKVLGRESK